MGLENNSLEKESVHLMNDRHSQVSAIATKTRNFAEEVFGGQEIGTAFLNRHIGSIGLRISLQNRLLAQDINSVHDLLAKTEDEIMRYMRDPKAKKKTKTKKSEKLLKDLEEILLEEHRRSLGVNIWQ